MPPQLYVNPACSKCRTAVSILEEHAVQADEVRYLDEPPTMADLRRLMTRLGIDDPLADDAHRRARLRRVGARRPDGDALLDAITRHPMLLERPIFVAGERAVIARPPERLLELL